LEYYRADITTEEELPEMDLLDAIVYCPGSINLKPIGSLKVADFLSDFTINVLGAVRVVKKYQRTLKKGENASIILFSTVAVKVGMSFHSSVAAAKGAVEGLAKSLAAELAPNIRVNCIAPTLTDTPLAMGLLRNDDMREKMRDRHPMKSILSAEEVAQTVDFLISPAARNITGQIIQLDAGITTIKP
jgi:NAD(P)-dependent dehydrogenase (short-subunit alcohol dehydrogenase family)